MTRTLAVALSIVVALAGSISRAADNDVHIRIIQVKASGKRGSNAQPVLDADLAKVPGLTAHFNQAPLSGYKEFALLGSAVKKGASGSSLSFELSSGYKAEVTPRAQGDDKIEVVLKVTKPDRGKDEKVFTTTLEFTKDGATAVQVIARALGEKNDLVLMLTASRHPF